jgi:hypothetical protein
LKNEAYGKRKMNIDTRQRTRKSSQQIDSNAENELICVCDSQTQAHHAEPIPGENRPFADRINGVHYFDDLVVLKTATQPALLLEAGIIVHRAEELALQQSATRETMATAIAAAMDMCLRTKPLSVPSQGDAR